MVQDKHKKIIKLKRILRWVYNFHITDSGGLTNKFLKPN